MCWVGLICVLRTQIASATSLLQQNYCSAHYYSTVSATTALIGTRRARLQCQAMPGLQGKLSKVVAVAGPLEVPLWPSVVAVAFVKNKGKVALTRVSCSVLLNGCSSVCMPVRLSQLVYQQTLRFVRLHMLTVS